MQVNSLYSFVEPLTQGGLGEKVFPLSGIEQNYDNSLYVSLCDVEKWALSKGFHPVESMLRGQGISYWKGGKYFSNAQLLAYLNGIRLEKKLEPLRLFEEETKGGTL